MISHTGAISSQPTTASSTPLNLGNQFNSFLNAFKGGNGMMLLIAVGGWLLLAWLGNSHKKSKLATAEFASGREKQRAKRLALQWTGYLES